MKTETKASFNESYGSKPPENYERYFVSVIGEPLARDLLRLANIQKGERVLDVACGTGIIARLALQQTGPRGTVCGVDMNPGMLAMAHSLTPETTISWHEASAEEMPLPDASFDVAICQISLQFMEEPVAALREMHRLLVPGGRLILNVPGPAGDLFVIMAESMERNIGPQAAGFVNRVFSIDDPEMIRHMAVKAGFDDVEVRTQNKLFPMPAPKDFLWQYIYATPLAGVIAEADEDSRASLEKEIVGKWQEFLDDGAFIYEQRIISVRATK